MQKEVINAFGKVFYKIVYSRELDIVQAEWFGYTTKQDLKKALVVGLQLHEETRCAYRLNDNTLFSGPWEDAVGWLEEEWLPRAYKAGIRYLAHVARPNSFGEAAGEALQLSKIGAAIEVRLFTDKAEALAWLQTKQKSLASL